jgi:2-keto-4-pentenoate hydratase
LTQPDERIRRGLQAQLRESQRRAAGGERRTGWKVALNDPRVQEALRIEAPVIGCLSSATALSPAREHSLTGATRPAIEPEIAVHVGADGEVAALGAALEVIDVDLPFDDLELILERNVFHRGYALGAPVAGISSPDGLSASFRRDGTEVHRIDVAAAAIDPAGVVALVQGYLSPLGESLQAGEVIIAGSLVTALPVTSGERYELIVDGMEPVSLAFGPA